jgi:hypothetical protein
LVFSAALFFEVVLTPLWKLQPTLSYLFRLPLFEKEGVRGDFLNKSTSGTPHFALLFSMRGALRGQNTYTPHLFYNF